MDGDVFTLSWTVPDSSPLLSWQLDRRVARFFGYATAQCRFLTNGVLSLPFKVVLILHLFGIVDLPSRVVRVEFVEGAPLFSRGLSLDCMLYTK